MNRELVTLLPTSSALDIQLILDHAHNMLSTHSITSAEFRNHFQACLGRNAAQFIHELLNFARSPYDLSGYDNAVQFQEFPPELPARSSTIQEVSSASDAEPEEGVSRAFNNLLNSLRTNRRYRTNRMLNRLAATTTSSTSTSTNTSPRSTPQANHTRDSVIVERNSNSVDLPQFFRDSAESDIINLVIGDEIQITPSMELPDNISLSSSLSDDSELEIIDVIEPTENGHRSDSVPLSITVPDAIVEETVEISAAPQTSAPTRIESDGSDVEFVLALKPPHLRTPDMVSLNSESDSDVIFVGDPKVNDDSDSSDNVPLAQLKTETSQQEPGVSKLDVLASIAVSQEQQQSNRNRIASKPLSFSMVPIKIPPRNMGVKRIFEHHSDSSTCTSCVSATSSTSSSSSTDNRDGKKIKSVHRKRMKLIKEANKNRNKKKIRERPLEELPSTEQVIHDNEAGPSNGFSNDLQYKPEKPEAKLKVKSMILKKFKDDQYNILLPKSDSSD